jgi:peptidyl-prolyl cis-trans isomerase SurA
VFNSPKILKAAVIVLVSFLTAACGSKSNDAGSEVAAKVGSQEITIRQVDSVIKQQLDASNGPPLAPTELVAARLTVLDNLIQEEALFQKAQKENLVPDDGKVNQEVQSRKQQAGLTEEQYQNSISQAGLTEQDVREKIKRELAIAALRDREKTRVAAPTDAEIERYFNERKDQFVAERGVDLSVIVTDPANNGAADDAQGEAQAEQKIRAIYEQLRGGADFATVASQRSEHQSALRSGSVGFATEPALKQTFPTMPDISQRLFSMSAGQYTEPVRDNASGAWVIFKVNARRDQTQNLTLDNPAVRKNIIDTITQQRQQVLLNALMMAAVADASIKNYLAERIVENPKTIVEMSPSQLLNQTGDNRPQPQPTPRFENENQNSSAPATPNANRGGATGRPAAGANGNSRPPTANANR